MKTGECVRYVKDEPVNGAINSLQVSKKGAGAYIVKYEYDTYVITRDISSSAIIRHIIRTAEDVGYKKEVQHAQAEAQAECNP